ncbi:MAG: hypothetical protein QM760_21930 [Nibricoccus sp.]
MKPIRAEMETINQLNDHYQGGAGYRVLGVSLITKCQVSAAPAMEKRALEELDKALTISPEHPFNLFYTADYFFTVGEKQKAAEYLQRLQALQTSAEADHADLLSIQMEGKKLAEKIR